MTDYRWIAVRCCCQPSSVLGFLRVTAEQAAQPFLTVPPPGRKFGFDRYTAEKGPTLEPPLRIQIRDVLEGLGIERAIYSDDHPLAFWREVAGFVEAALDPRHTGPVHPRRDAITPSAAQINVLREIGEYDGLDMIAVGTATDLIVLELERAGLIKVVEHYGTQTLWKLTGHGLVALAAKATA